MSVAISLGFCFTHFVKKMFCPSSECADKAYCFVKKGFYLRGGSNRPLQRYFCKNCRHYFSRATHSIFYRQHKIYLNSRIWQELCSKKSQRRLALIIGINRK